MAAVVRFQDFRRPRPYHSFTRSELNRLLGLYATRVMRGEWRDYAISHGADCASFAVFRNSQDHPLFEIVKLGAGKKVAGAAAKAGRFVVTSRQSKLSQGQSLDDVLAVFDRPLTLVTA
ncbi:MAG: DUF2794 domain-containing protein [Rhodospirillaceae bacterium]|nr:DUF2794 domain-containing protein [Rhodospirillaceae bacterium]